eukprot:GILJ01012371.1.p1 GENE.GILJ01012371.1~~GILJ01012371.1.p1  ORF type:complete len:494 (-),score=59.73 GILJ01012371.1:474-1955(-)
MECLEAEDADIAQYFKSTVLPIAVTFNKFANVHPGEHKWSVDSRLGIRMLFSYFGGDSTFDVFTRWCIDHLEIDDITPLFVRGLIVEHQRSLPAPKTTVLLLVDETMKAATPNENAEKVAVQMLYAIGTFLEQTPKPYLSDAIVSSLDAKYFGVYSAGSSREWVWLPLGRLYDGATQLFDVNKHAHFGSEAVQQAIVECSGHPRSLETLYRLATANPSFTAQQLRERLVEVCQIIPTLGMLVLVILGLPVHPEAKPDGSERTYRELAAASVYLNNAPPTDAKFTPQMSTILMWKFVHEVERTSSVADRIHFDLARALRRLLESASFMAPPIFEVFHAEFELCRRLLSQGQTTTLAKQYPLAQSPGWDPANVSFVLSGSAIARETELFHNAPAVLSDCEIVRTYPHSNPGFDSTSVQKRLDDKDLLLCFETRWSEDVSSTTLDAASVKHKIQMTADSFNLALKANPGIDMTIKDVVLVLASYRDVPKYQKESIA